ncbi:DUF559 domain-containing protein [Brachybacterium sp. Marseille-Q7125]|uniref:endonuclease domain-containing protein n=1 Tax=Brachybacterium sp. Marseille-Q7125 TaxID=2932815 RepID=UPI001FF6E4D5|nr:DUF559 domain-containing protein [Brachybacterium sp. Marseille-Q7125]
MSTVALTPHRAVAPGHVLSRQTLMQVYSVTSRRLASEEFVRVLPGFYTSRASPAPLRNIALTATEKVVPGAVVSGVTAAELLGLPLPRTLTWAGGVELHLDVSPSQRRRSARGLRIHVREGIRPHRLRSGVWSAEPCQVLMDLAALLPHDDLVACIDALGSLRREELRIPVESIRARAQWLTGRGVVAVRRAAQEARDAVDSPRETRTRLLVHRAGLPEPEINVPVHCPVTGIRYSLDLAYPQARIAIEYDGEVHFALEQARHDRRKDEVLHEQGWKIYRLTVQDHRDPGPFLRWLRHHLLREQT